MKKYIKFFVQKIIGKFLNVPVILSSETKGFSLQRSQVINLHASEKTKLYSPYSFRNVDIDDYSYIATNCTISNTIIGKFCSIGPNFCCGMGIHPINGISTSPMFYSVAKQNGYTLVEKNLISEEKITKIGNDVFIGVNVTILDGIVIGNGAVIAAGSVVTRDIPAYAIAAGVPAKVIKFRFEQDIIDKFQKTEWWNFDSSQLSEINKYFFEVKSFLDKGNM